MKRPISSDLSSADQELSVVQCGDIFPPHIESIDDAEYELDEAEPCTNPAAAAAGLFSGAGEKKRRLSVEQVRSLERHFEVENKLDPDRKTRLALDLGLQPRQVAVWFQNRRARSKTKQIERDFGALKSRHDELLRECESLRRDKESLTSQIRELKAKLENSQAKSVKLEMNRTLLYRDGSSDSDSSVVFNDETAIEDQKQYFMASLPTNYACKDFIEEGFLPSEEELGNGLFSDEHVSNLSSWYSSSDAWVD